MLPISDKWCSGRRSGWYAGGERFKSVPVPKIVVQVEMWRLFVSSPLALVVNLHNITAFQRKIMYKIWKIWKGEKTNFSPLILNIFSIFPRPRPLIWTVIDSITRLKALKSFFDLFFCQLTVTLNRTGGLGTNDKYRPSLQSMRHYVTKCDFKQWAQFCYTPPPPHLWVYIFPPPRIHGCFFSHQRCNWRRKESRMWTKN